MSNTELTTAAKNIIKKEVIASTWLIAQKLNIDIRKARFILKGLETEKVIKKHHFSYRAVTVWCLNQVTKLE